MADIDNLIIEHLRAVRGDLFDIREMLREQGCRLARLEGSLKVLIQRSPPSPRSPRLR